MRQATADIARHLAAMAGALLFSALALHVADAQSRTGATLIRHDFTESAQGWRISGDSGPDEPIFSASGGHPGGCITGIDEALGETWYFRAPAAVLQQLPAAVNGTLSYSLKQS